MITSSEPCSSHSRWAATGAVIVLPLPSPCNRTPPDRCPPRHERPRPDGGTVFLAHSRGMANGAGAAFAFDTGGSPQAHEPGR